MAEVEDAQHQRQKTSPNTDGISRSEPDCVARHTPPMSDVSTDLSSMTVLLRFELETAAPYRFTGVSQRMHALGML